MQPARGRPLRQRALGRVVQVLQGTAPHEGSFHDYVQARNPGLLDYEHVPRLVDVGQRLADRELLRVLVLLPPRYFKSEVYSRLLPGYDLLRRPRDHVGLVSYGAKLAWELSGEARTYYQTAGGSMSPDTTGKPQWHTDAGGRMWAAGVGGPLLGFGYDLGIIDDPIDPKGRTETFMRQFATWWPRRWYSRREPGAAMVVVMQRLEDADPIDFLFRREVGADGADLAPQNWHVVVCDEVKSDAPLGDWDGPQGLPPTCTLEPDPRPRGMVLAPSRFSPEEVEETQRSSGPYVTAAQRQQRPMAPTGDFWREGWFRTYDELPPKVYNVGTGWDPAYTKHDLNSASAWVRTGRGPGPHNQFPIYVLDADWDWWEFPGLVAAMRRVAGPHHVEAKASGKSAAQVLRPEGLAVHEVQVRGGDKLARASAVQNVVSSGRVYVQRSLVRRLLHAQRQGLLRVRADVLAKGGRDLDLHDAFVQELQRHVLGARVRFR